jgi:Tol biopolymer transport system component
MMVVAQPPQQPQIAFTRSVVASSAPETWIEKPNGSDRRRRHAGRAAVWSHDGRRVVFASLTSRDTVIVYVEDADGSGRHRIARLPGGESCVDARWSPDDSAIALAVGCEIDGTTIWVLRGGHKPRRFGRGRFCCVAPRWSPDGRSLLVGDFVPNRLVRIDVATGTQQRIPHTRFSDVRWFWAWSKRGDRVYFIGADDALHTVKLDGSGRRQLIRDLAVSDFDLSPDGQTIVFTGSDGRRRSIYSVPARGGNGQKLTDGRHDYQPAWSPGGRLIAFTREYVSAAGVRTNVTHIFTMRADGSQQRDVSGATNGNNDDNPRWIP